MNLDFEDVKTIFFIGIGFFSIISFFWCTGLALRLRSINKRTALLVAAPDEALEQFSQDLEAASAQIADQARRIAWLESRVRKSVPAQKQNADELFVPPAKPTLTEIRHRVLTLAQRGLDVNSISEMLGEMPGEIELIINLSRAA
jgi:hypothetical protein